MRGNARVFVHGSRKEYDGIEMVGRNNVRRGVSLLMETAEKKALVRNWKSPGWTDT